MKPQSQNQSPLKATGSANKTGTATRKAGSDSHDRIVANIFRDVATTESLIESKRQELAGHPDFEPFKVFEMINTDKSGSLDTAQFMEFFKKQLINAEPHAVEAMIHEFDGEGRRCLGFDEFCQMVLPAANSGLRELSLKRRDSPYFRPHAPLPYEVVSLVTRLLDKEITFHRQRAEAIASIAKQEDFDRRKLFETITRGYHSICMADLIFFLEKNGFYPRREDIEAILRRLDHDADKSLSFEEFCEITGPEPEHEDQLSREEDEEIQSYDESATPLRKTQEERANYDQKFEEKKKATKKPKDVKRDEKPKGSTEKKQKPQSPRSSAKKQIDSKEQKRRETAKKNAAQERAHLEADMAAEQQRRREEREAREKAEREAQEAREREESQRQTENFMFLRLIKLLVKQNKHIESLREQLFSHKHFNVVDTFKLFDHDNTGTLDAQKFSQCLAHFGHESLDLNALQILVEEIVDDDDDGTVDLREFTEAVTPRAAEFKMGGKGSMAMLSPQQRHVVLQAIMDTLAELFEAMVGSEYQVQQMKESCQVDGEKIFNQIDQYKLGYISTVSLANWIVDNCGFVISAHELAALQRRFDKHDKYRIQRAVFVRSVSAFPDENEEEEQERESQE